MLRTFSAKMVESNFYVSRSLKTILSVCNYISSLGPALRRKAMDRTQLPLLITTVEYKFLWAMTLSITNWLSATPLLAHYNFVVYCSTGFRDISPNSYFIWFLWLLWFLFSLISMKMWVVGLACIPLIVKGFGRGNGEICAWVAVKFLLEPRIFRMLLLLVTEPQFTCQATNVLDYKRPWSYT